MNLADVGSLPTTLTDAQAAEVYGVSVDVLGDMARAGRTPVAALWIGRCRRWPTVEVLASVGIEWEPASAPESSGT